MAQACANQTDTTVYFAADSLYGNWSLQVGPSTATKWAGVVAYCTHAGINTSAALGIGDDVNDIEYLEQSQIAIAMQHAKPEVQAVFTTTLPAGDGWSSVLDYV